MGFAQTFDDLKNSPVSRKISVVEVTVGEQPAGWEQVGSSDAYGIPYKYENVALTEGSVSKVLKRVSELREDGAGLTEKTNLADVQNTQGSWWHDTAESQLYVHTLDDASPETHVVVAYFPLYFASEDGVMLDGRYWEPYVISIPNASSVSQSIFSGTSVFGSGEVSLSNTHGFFDVIFGKYIWENGRAVCRIGGDLLNYEEYQTTFTGLIGTKSWAEDRVVLNLESIHKRLDRTFPKNMYTMNDFPNLENNAVGRPIPVAYGIFTNDAPLCVCVDTAYTGGKRQFKICDHPIVSIQQVQVNFGDGVGWRDIDHGDVSLSDAKFTVLNSDFLGFPDWDAGWVEGSTLVRAQFHGRDTDGSGTAQRVPANIVKDLLTNASYGMGNEVTDADLDLEEFSGSAANSDATLNVWIGEERPLTEIIDKIARSDLAFFYARNDGALVYRTWYPFADPSGSAFDRTDFLSMSVAYNVEDFHTEVGVQYGFGYSTGEWNQVTISDADSISRYKNSLKRIFETFIVDPDEARILAQRLLLLGKSPMPRLTFKTKLQGFDRDLGDIIRVTSHRAPFEDPDGWIESRFEIVSVSRDFSDASVTITCDLMKGAGQNVGFLTEPSARVWTDPEITGSEKGNNGFWSNPNGFIDSADSNSKDRSIWW